MSQTLYSIIGFHGMSIWRDVRLLKIAPHKLLVCHFSVQIVLKRLHSNDVEVIMSHMLVMHESPRSDFTSNNNVLLDTTDIIAFSRLLNFIRGFGCI